VPQQMPPFTPCGRCMGRLQDATDTYRYRGWCLAERIWFGCSPASRAVNEDEGGRPGGRAGACRVPSLAAA